MRVTHREPTLRMAPWRFPSRRHVIDPGFQPIEPLVDLLTHLAELLIHLTFQRAEKILDSVRAQWRSPHL
jgi:hypothetical protein